MPIFIFLCKLYIVTLLRVKFHNFIQCYLEINRKKTLPTKAAFNAEIDTVSAGHRHTNVYELRPSSSHFIFILI
jgi:hypothetical protein